MAGLREVSSFKLRMYGGTPVRRREQTAGSIKRDWDSGYSLEITKHHSAKTKQAKKRKRTEISERRGWFHVSLRGAKAASCPFGDAPANRPNTNTKRRRKGAKKEIRMAFKSELDMKILQKSWIYLPRFYTISHIYVSRVMQRLVALSFSRLFWAAVVVSVASLPAFAP